MKSHLDAGFLENELVSSFDKRDIGGRATLNQEKGGTASATMNTPTPQSEWPEVKTAWCNPQADDDCYINSKKVPVAELGKWLPDISESNADQLGGQCESASTKMTSK